MRSLIPAALLLLITGPVLAASLGMSVTKRIAAPDGGWDYVNVSADGKTMLVARSDGVMTIDLATGAVNPHLVAAQRTHGAVTVPGTSIGMVTSTTSGGALLFDAGTGAVVADIKTGTKPDAAAYDPATGMLLVMDNAGGGVAVIDPKTKALVGKVAVAGALESAAVDAKGTLYVNIEDKGAVAVIDVARRAVVRTIDLTGCEEPGGLALTKQGYLISACANGHAKVVEAKSGRLLADIAIGSRPDAVIYDGPRDRAYVPTGGDGGLTVIDTADVPRGIGVVSTQKGSRTGAADPATGDIYLPGARFAPAEAGQRPKAIPGSFEVLVVSK
ncbi:YncE family protein [Glacieibacterium megasporae]|uniref:YncE family protein n=1 Tax=Glacieibacterium megasporae TaxID=2835787 RepID=UPI001C1E760F|nr:YncE family protein [Polymorphobacter megasporae]UAJ09065.1 YncE family protein [Polymorphobacter megasporae]